MCSPSFPFADYDHLRALEDTECVGAEAGWVPFYLALFDRETLVGATYLYIKNNSYGEFIFDFAWARAYAQHQINYFPKVVSAVPFTPATGEKILVHPKADGDAVRRILIEQSLSLMNELKCSSAHFLFLPKERLSVFAEMGLSVRHSFQYHWKNAGYKTFDDFLAALTSKRRRQIALERRQLAETGVTIQAITGNALTKQHAALMTELYLDTNAKMGSHACLNLAYFETVFDKMSDRTVLFVAKKAEKPIAAAVNFFKGKAMYGRYWGCFEDVRNLHFELCYYQAIDFCIANEIERYEAGAQGEHKFSRGFLPELTYSAHAIVHPQFKVAIESFIEEEKRALEQMVDDYKQHSPFR